MHDRFSSSLFYFHRSISRETSLNQNQSNECQNQIEFLYNLPPKINGKFRDENSFANEFNVVTLLKDTNLKDYSSRFRPEQLFCCPKDPRPRRQKCFGSKIDAKRFFKLKKSINEISLVYYDLFDDVCHLFRSYFISS